MLNEVLLKIIIRLINIAADITERVVSDIIFDKR